MDGMIGDVSIADFISGVVGLVLGLIFPALRNKIKKKD